MELRDEKAWSPYFQNILRGYPPDLQEDAVKTVLQQAELLCADWSDSAI